MSGIVVATVGLCGTGKSVITDYFAKEHGFQTVYFGGRVLEEVRRRGLEVNAANEKAVREALREEGGMAVMASLSLPKIRTLLDEGQDVVIDGLYSYAEYVILREHLTDCFSVIAVHAQKPLRYQRLGRREVRPLTPEQVDERDLSEIRNLEKSDPIVLADYHMVNDADLPALQTWIEIILRGIRA